MRKDPIKAHSTALVAGMLAESKALAGVVHPGHKGTCREWLLADLLKHFLPSFLSLSTGIIVNSSGMQLKDRQSNQADIIIYDNRILPPFLEKGELGMVPIESVVGVVEVKTILNKSELVTAVAAAKRLYREIPLVVLDLVSPEWWRKVNGDQPTIELLMRVFSPHMAVFAYAMEGVPELRYQKHEEVVQWGRRIADWCDKTLLPISSVCVAEHVSCVKFSDGWRPNGPQPDTHEEIKRFIAVLLDNCRARAERRYCVSNRRHVDWLSSYIRHQGS